MHFNIFLKNRLLFALVFLAGAAGTASIPVRIKPHLYLGGGIGVTSGVQDQPFLIEDGIDQNYVSLNYDLRQRTFSRGQIRLNLLEVDRFSVGYVFWSHYRKYPFENSEYWVKRGKSYPYSDNLNFHGIALQWDLRYPVISSRFFLPFLLAGAGKAYGSSNSFQFEFIDDMYYYSDKRQLKEEQAFSGTVRIYGCGLILLRYLYVYVGATDFEMRPTPVRRSLDVVAGVRI